MSRDSWKETWSCSSTAGTFLNTRTTRSSCSYGPAESHTPESWPCLLDEEVCVCVCVSLCHPNVFLADCSHAVWRRSLWPCAPGPGRVAPLLQLPSALTLPDQSVTERPLSSGSLEKVVTLEESMKQLERGTQSGTLSFHFEVFEIHSGAKHCKGI